MVACCQIDNLMKCLTPTILILGLYLPLHINSSYPYCGLSQLMERAKLKLTQFLSPNPKNCFWKGTFDILGTLALHLITCVSWPLDWVSIMLSIRLAVKNKQKLESGCIKLEFPRQPLCVQTTYIVWYSSVPVGFMNWRTVDACLSIKEVGNHHCHGSSELQRVLLCGWCCGNDLKVWQNERSTGECDCPSFWFCILFGFYMCRVCLFRGLFDWTTGHDSFPFYYCFPLRGK